MNALRDSMLSAQGYREEWEIPLLFFHAYQRLFSSATFGL